MAGYSGTPLPRKLGIKTGHLVAFLGTPADFSDAIGDLPEHVTVRGSLKGKAAFDVIVLFAKSRAHLERRFDTLARRLKPAGGLWIAWPKRSSGVATDLIENAVREVGLTAGLVDNKVCAIDDTCSGLRFVVRVKDRR